MNICAKTRNKLFYSGNGLQNWSSERRHCHHSVYLPTPSENNNGNSQILHWVGMLAYCCLTSATTELHLLLHSSAEPYLSRVYQKDPSDHWPSHAWQHTHPRHDNPIRWEDPGRRYGRNGVETSLPWSETHFLMHNKAFILLAVTRKVFVREGAREFGLKVQRILYSSSVTGVVWWKEGQSKREWVAAIRDSSVYTFINLAALGFLLMGFPRADKTESSKIPRLRIL